MLTLLLLVAATSQDPIPTTGRPAQTQPDTAVSRATPDSSPALETMRIRARVQAQGYVPSQSSSALRTTEPLRTTPQSITVLIAPALVDLGLHTMTRAVAYLPGITMGQGEGHRDAPTIRGQSTTADFFVDGVRDDAQYLRDNYNVEQLEAIKGANALAFGRGGGGGVINRVSKRAGWAPVRTLRFETGSFDTRRLTADVGGALASPLAGRLNVLHEHRRSFRDEVGSERYGVTPTITLYGAGTLIRAGGEFYRDRRTTDRGLPSANGGPSTAPIDRFFGDPDLSRSNADVLTGFVIGERALGAGVLLRSHIRTVSYDKFYQNVYAASALDTDAQTVRLGAYNSGTARRSVFNQTDLSWDAARGAVRSTLLVGGELSHQRSDNTRLTGFFPGEATMLAVPFGAPRINQPVRFAARGSDADNRATASIAALYLQEQLRLGDHVQLIGGARFDRVIMALDDRRDGARYERIDRIVSPRVSLVLTPSRSWSFYASHGTSALPSSGDQFAGLNASTSTLAPERFRSNELGVKWGLDDRFEAGAAVYRVDRSNSAAPDPTDITRLVQTGRQRSDGVELSASGSPMARWRLIAAMAVQRARIVEQSGSALAGTTAPLVPRSTLSLWNSVDVAPGLSIGAGVVHQGRRYAALDNSVTLPAFSRVDASVEWSPAALVRRGRSDAAATWLRALSVQLRAENLLNTRYYATSHGNNNIMPGTPRLLQLSLSVQP